MPRQIRAFTVFTLALAGLMVQINAVQAETKTRRSRTTSSRPITKPKFDPLAERVALFEGMKEGQLKTKVIAQGPSNGSVLVTNNTDKPLTVELPPAFVAVKVLKQFGGGGGFGQQGGGLGGGGLGGQQGGGGQQNAGGGFGGGQQGGGLGGGGLGGGAQGGGQGFFSIPPERTVKVPYVSACLNHGKADPTPNANYQIVPVEDYTKDPILQELITMVGTGRMAPNAAQAAIWNRTDNMSWQQLAAKFSYGPVGNKLPYFSRTDLQGAQLITSTAIGRIRERENNKPVESGNATEETPVASRVR